MLFHSYTCLPKPLGKLSQINFLFGIKRKKKCHTFQQYLGIFIYVVNKENNCCHFVLIILAEELGNHPVYRTDTIQPVQ